VDWSAFAGNPHLIRLSASLLDRGEDACPDYAAVKARPDLRPRVSEQRRYPPWADFPLGLVMTVLDAVEHDGVNLNEAIATTVANGRARVHPGVARWIGHAAESYLDVSDALTEGLADEGVILRPARVPRVVQGGRSPAELRVLTAWGRWYESVDGAVVEFRRLRMGRPRGTADQPSTLAMAFIAGLGEPVADPRDVYRAFPVPTQKDLPRPSRVRVVEVGLTSGTEHVLLDTGPGEIRRTYQNKVRPVAQKILAGGGGIPGRDCTTCRTRPSCDALPTAPGLLGLRHRGTHRRIWSVTTSRRYEVCPAQAHLQELWIPGESDSSPAAARGRAVHRWLAAAHARGRACTAADLPEATAEDCGLADAVLDRADYHEARPYLLGHLDVCPLNAPEGVTEIRCEPTIAAYDSVADVIVIAEPDLLRRVHGRLVYREVKTSAAPRGLTRENALSAVPQLALAVCLIAAGVFGSRDGLVELEELHPSAAEPLLVFDAADPSVIAAARAVAYERVARWHTDIRFAANPGWWCRYCPVSRWCPDAATDGSGEWSGPQARAIAELVTARETDEPPF
jgi:hypothetical protein